MPTAYTIEADTKPGTWGLCSDGFYRLLETNGFVQDVPVLSNFDQIEAYEFFNITAAEARRLFPDNLERPSFPDEDYRRGWIQKRVRTQRVVWRSIVTAAGSERHQGTIAEAIEAAEKLTNCGEWAIKEPSMFDRTGSGWVEIAAESDDPEIQKRRASAKGGAARTERKAAAVVENGKKGGRPRKVGYQLVAGTPSQPGGVCNGYFTSASEARKAHPHVSGYTRRVKLIEGIPKEMLWGAGWR